MRYRLEDIEEAFLALDFLELASARLEKEEILSKYSKNQTLSELFRMALGGDKYYVRPSNKLVSSASSKVDKVSKYEDFLSLANKLKTREVTGNEASNAVENFLRSLPPNMGKWLTRVFLHDLRVGVSLKTISKVWGREFWVTKGEEERGWFFNGCQLAKKYEDVYGRKKIEFPIAAELKLDGHRALIFAFPQKNEIYIFSRGKKRQTHIEEVSEFKNQVLDYVTSLNGGQSYPVFLDGELMAFDRSWNTTAKIVRKTKNFNKDDFLQTVGLVLFDFAPLEAYQSGSFNLPWKERKHLMLAAAGQDRAKSGAALVSKNLSVIGHKILWDEDSLNEAYESAIDRGWEGLMLKTLDAPHVFKNKRPASVVKLKPEDEHTGIIVEVVPGKGKHAAVSEENLSAVLKTMKKLGPVKADGAYLHLLSDNVSKDLEYLKEKINDSADRRLSSHYPGAVSYRYGERLGYFVVSFQEKTLRVGGGFKHKAGEDERMEFWKRRDELLGMSLDFICQSDPQQVAEGRFNRFKRLREDL